MPHIVVVDDNHAVRDAMLDVLTDAGYDAVGFADGGEALRQLPALRPRLVILDLMMPGIDGADFLARLRAMEATAEVPVVIVSGVGDALLGSIDDAEAAGDLVYGVLPKPVPYEQLLGTVSRIIGPAAEQS